MTNECSLRVIIHLSCFMCHPTTKEETVMITTLRHSTEYEYDAAGRRILTSSPGNILVSHASERWDDSNQELMATVILRMSRGRCQNNWPSFSRAEIEARALDHGMPPRDARSGFAALLEREVLSIVDHGDGRPELIFPTEEFIWRLTGGSM